MGREHIHFVTGKLAAPALTNILGELAEQVEFEYSIQILPITVAALMTPEWIAPRLKVPAVATQILLPGHCDGDLSAIEKATTLPIAVGPKDLRSLPDFFGKTARKPALDKYAINIIAEINHAPRYSVEHILKTANALRRDGANLIDVGCEPNSCWNGVADCVRALRDAGHRVSIDSLNPQEIGPAVNAGAELVLSVNQSNLRFAPDWGCEVVVIPNDIRDLDSLEPSIKFLEDRRVPFRIDPIVEPIGFGFAASLNRYYVARHRWPEFEMMMGIGNLTELTDVDSAGINVLLLAICEELRIHSVLTTQVINWARSSVRECDIARRLVHYSIQEKIPPKHLSTDLLTLRDEKMMEFDPGELTQLASQIRDHNYRIFSAENQIHLLGGGQHFSHQDPFEVFDSLVDAFPDKVDASHAFYLGFEMCKAMLANQLGKQYHQDQSLNWGHLTIDERDRHRLKRRKDRNRS